MFGNSSYRHPDPPQKPPTKKQIENTMRMEATAHIHTCDALAQALTLTGSNEPVARALMQSARFLRYFVEAK